LFLCGTVVFGNTIAVSSDDRAMRNLIAQKSLDVVERDGNHILSSAYPLAFGALRYKSSESLGVSYVKDYYKSSVRLNYINLIGSMQ
jgi:hypothetical protein